MKVDISPKSDMDELEVNNYNPLEVVEEPNIEEDEAKATVEATKFIRSGEASKLGHGKNLAIKAPPTPQYDNETVGNSRYLDRACKLLRE